MALTVLVDYDSGNLHSAKKAFQRMALQTNAGEVLVSSRPEDVARADRIVLPGDGAFPSCRRALGSYGGLFEAIEEGKIDPSFVISHRLNLADAPKAYEQFNVEKDPWRKVVLKPH